MASAQMGLPIEGTTPVRAVRPVRPVSPVANPAPAPSPAGPVASAPSRPASATTTGPVSVAPAPRWVRRTTTAGVLVVAVVAALGSYEHMRALGVEVGEGWRAGLLPFSVDGLGVVAAMTMLVRRWAGQPAGLLAWAALVLSLGVSLAANVAAAEPTVEARLWAAWPPVGLLMAIELLMQQVKARGGPGVHTARPGASFQPHGGEPR
jgi:Protein of unknown function (DUF2637)